MNRKDNNSQIIYGFVEGVTFPIIALLIFQLLTLPTMLMDVFKLPPSSDLASTQNSIYLTFEAGCGLISFAVFIIEPFLTGLTSFKSAFGYIIGSVVALLLFVTQISNFIPEIQIKVTEDLLLVVIGMAVKIIWVINKIRTQSNFEEGI